MNERILNLLGIARRAGKISIGHDAAVQSVVRNKAKLCVMSVDASERLKSEMLHACTYENKNIRIIELDVPIEVFSKAIGCKAVVLTVDDEGFAGKIKELYGKAQQAN